MRYSNDLREKAINLLAQGKQQKEVAKLFGIDKSTIYRWNKRHKTTGLVSAKDYNRTGNRRKITDVAGFRSFLEKNSHLSLKEMAYRWKGVSYMCISNLLKKLGYSYKKSSGYIRKETRSKESDISKR